MEPPKGPRYPMRDPTSIVRRPPHRPKKKHFSTNKELMRVVKNDAVHGMSVPDLSVKHLIDQGTIRKMLEYFKVRAIEDEEVYSRRPYNDMEFTGD